MYSLGKKRRKEAATKLKVQMTKFRAQLRRAVAERKAKAYKKERAHKRERASKRAALLRKRRLEKAAKLRKAERGKKTELRRKTVERKSKARARESKYKSVVRLRKERRAKEVRLKKVLRGRLLERNKKAAAKERARKKKERGVKVSRRKERKVKKAHKCLRAKKFYFARINSYGSTCNKMKGSTRHACFIRLKSYKISWYRSVTRVCPQKGKSTCRSAKAAYKRRVLAAFSACNRKTGNSKRVCWNHARSHIKVWRKAMWNSCKKHSWTH